MAEQLFNNPNGRRGSTKLNLTFAEIYKIVREKLNYFNPDKSDPDAFCQDMCVRIEKLMGIYPNLPECVPSPVPAPAEPITTRNEEAGFTEVVNEDVPYIARRLVGSEVEALLDVDTRRVIGYRVFDLPFAPAEVEKAVEPFLSFARHAVSKAESGWVWETSSRERICDWFGPSDFGLLLHFFAERTAPHLAAAPGWRDAIERLKMAGGAMANMLFNLKQGDYGTERVREQMDKAQRYWDDAIQALPTSPSPSQGNSEGGSRG